MFKGCTFDNLDVITNLLPEKVSGAYCMEEMFSECNINNKITFGKDIIVSGRYCMSEMFSKATIKSV